MIIYDSTIYTIPDSEVQLLSCELGSTWSMTKFYNDSILPSVMPELSVIYQPVTALAACPYNARIHSKHQIRQIADSITAFGFVNPILIDNDNTIVAGHGRLLAAQILGMELVPTIRLETLTEAQIRAYLLADNKLAQNAGWDKSILAIELEHLLTIDERWDVTITGFEVPEIDLILQEAAQEGSDDYIEPVDAGPAVTKLGDLWLLGKHKILCSSSLEEASFSALMGSHKAHMVFIDPPYNVVIEGNVSGKGAVKHEDFKMASGKMNEV